MQTLCLNQYKLITSNFNQNYKVTTTSVKDLYDRGFLKLSPLKVGDNVMIKSGKV